MKQRVSVLALILFSFTACANAEILAGDQACSQTELHIRQSNDRVLEVFFRLPGVSTITVYQGEEQFDLLYMPGEGSTGVIGAPETPTITRLFALPNRAGVRIESIQPQFRAYRNVNPYPHQEYEYGSSESPDNWEFDEQYYGRGKFFPEKWIEIGRPAIMRDVRLIPITISPVRVNPVTGEAQVLTGILVRLAFDEGAAENVKSRAFRVLSSSFGKMYRQMLSNYDYINPNGMVAKGSFLIIYPNVSGVEAILRPYADWKKRRGYHTEMVAVPNSASTTQVKNIIQNAYDTYDPPLEHVVLVGDANGSIAISCWTYNSGETDHTYTMLEGDDILPDITLGRLSVSGTNDLNTVINKILYYEQNPTLQVTDWYKSGALIAGSSISGWSTIQINQWIRLQLLELGFTEVDTMWYTMGSSPTIENFMITEMNDGVSVFHFRGMQGMNGWSPSQILQLQNSYKPPFATCLTCDTGSFSHGLAASEAFLRAGTQTTPKGAIAAVGTATTLTHTRYNNSMDQGMWAGLLEMGLTEAGPAVFFGKIELYRTYQHDWATGHCFIYWNNLMGDPSTDIWLDIPQRLVVSHPDTIPAGTGSFTVSVHDTLGAPLQGRYVNLWKGDETYTGGYTDENGEFTAGINVTTPGELLVTVTNHNDFPYQGEAAVVEYPLNLGLHQVDIFDGNTAVTSGNSDSTANPSERIALIIALKNYGSSRTATGVSAVISTPDTNTMVISGSCAYQDLSPGSVALPGDNLIVELGDNFRQGYRIPFEIDISSNQGTFTALFNIIVSSGEAVVDSLTVTGGYFNPGDTDNLVVYVRNTGQWGLREVTGAITVADTMVSIIDGDANFGDIAAGAVAHNVSNPFIINAHPYITNGISEVFTLHLVSSNGQTQDIHFNLTAGTVSADDPFGPDSYGYYCIDDFDELYEHHPALEWMDIRTVGIPLNLPDTGGDNDKSTVIQIPFNFPFYGETHNNLTVCSNGWMAFGSWAYITEFRNQTIPCSFGPPSGMIIPYWDNLKTYGGNSGVYQYYDQQNHRFIIEYYSCPHASYSTGIQTFEVILYDPAHYPTPTGDGEIVFQYQTFNAVAGPSTDHLYWTTGIMNHQHTDGLEYAFWNRYNPGAAQIQSGVPSGRAVKFTTHIPRRGPRPLSVDIEPLSPPVIIPRQGGSFRYSATVADTGSYTIDFDAWVHATLPNHLQFGPLLVRVGNRIEPGNSFTRTITQYIPGQAPPGNYWINAFLGDYTTREVWTTDSLPFVKTGTDPESSGEWMTSGWGEEEEAVSSQQSAVSSQRSAVSIYNPCPNPFNASTVARFELRDASYVTLAVYDITGREVAMLVEGYQPAGYHKVTFEAGDLSSGVYFAMLEAGGVKQVRKMLLVK